MRGRRQRHGTSWTAISTVKNRSDLGKRPRACRRTQYLSSCRSRKSSRNFLVRSRIIDARRFKILERPQNVRGFSATSVVSTPVCCTHACLRVRCGHLGSGWRLAQLATITWKDSINLIRSYSHPVRVGLGSTRVTKEARLRRVAGVRSPSPVASALCCV
jgi:hypothetical protein